MSFPLAAVPLTAVIVALAVGYLIVVYGLLALAKRTGRRDKTTPV